MTTVRYRLVYKDGSHGAWSTDKARIEADAKILNARIEKWEI